MATLPIYETTLNILKEAGFVLRVEEEAAVRLDATHIKTAFPNIINREADTAVPTPSSVIVLVNGTSAAITAVNGSEGIIELTDTTTATDTITVSYCYSPVDISFTEVVRNDVECAILQKMSKVDPCAPYETEVPYCIRMITRLWAAGLLLAKEYGYNVDLEQSSKDGYKKIEEAKQILEEFYRGGGQCGGDSDGQDEINGGSGAIEASDRGDLFVPHHRRNCDKSDCCFDREVC